MNKREERLLEEVSFLKEAYWKLNYYSSIVADSLLIHDFQKSDEVLKEIIKLNKEVMRWKI